MGVLSAYCPLILIFETYIYLILKYKAKQMKFFFGYPAFFCYSGFQSDIVVHCRSNKNSSAIRNFKR